MASVFSRIIQIAATILLPVFIILSGYLYYENRQIATKEMIVCTARGERGKYHSSGRHRCFSEFRIQVSILPPKPNNKKRKENQL